MHLVGAVLLQHTKGSPAVSLQLTVNPSQYALTWLASPVGEGVQGLVKTASSISKHPSFKKLFRC